MVVYSKEGSKALLPDNCVSVFYRYVILTLQCQPWWTVQTFNSSYATSISAPYVCECIECI